MPDPEFSLLGDAIWLDFINTACTPPGARDLLPDPAAYHRWTKAVKLDADAERVPFNEVLGLRVRLLSLAKALDAGRQPPSSAVHAINHILSSIAGQRQLIRVNGAWRTQFRPSRLPSALDAIATSAAATLSDPLIAVRRCTGEGCTLYFSDPSPQHTRLWCSTARCGQRMRVERRRGSRITPVV